MWRTGIVGLLVAGLAACAGHGPAPQEVADAPAASPPTASPPHVVSPVVLPPTPPGPRVGAPLTGIARDVPEVPGLPLLLTNHVPLEDCNPGTVVSRFGPSCAPAPIQGVRASGIGTGVEAAVDGSTCTFWNSNGHPPAALSLEMAEGASVAGLVLVSESTPLFPLVTHVIETSDDGENFVPAFRLHAITSTSIPYTVVFPTPIHRRFIRVRTVETASWVAWREVVPFSCGGPAVVPPDTERAMDVLADPPDAPTPTTGPRVETGIGRCTQDRQCAPERCCQPTRCVPAGRAPRCQGTTCPAVVGPLDGSVCACHEGTCSAVWPVGDDE